MVFTGNEGEVITLAQGTAWTANYRAAVGTGAIKGHAFGKNRITSLLAQDNCVGFRAYYAIDDLGAKQLVLVGTDANGCDLYNGIILDKSVLCPPFCDTSSPLCK